MTQQEKSTSKAQRTSGSEQSQTAGNQSGHQSQASKTQENSSQRAQSGGKAQQQRSGNAGAQSMTSQRGPQQGQTSIVPHHSGSGLSLFGDQDMHDFFHDPFAMMQRFARRMDHLFEDFGFRGSPTRRGDYDGSQQAMTRGGRGGSSWMPQMETFERDGSMVVRADLPGMKKEDIEIQLDDDMLTIQGARHQESSEESEGRWHSERSYGSFSRRMRLPKGVDPDKISASYTDGVLEVTIEKPEEQKQSRRIDLT